MVIRRSTDAVAVEIAVRQAARHFGRREAGARLRGDIAKNALAVVEEQVRRLRVSHIAVYAADRLIDVPVHGHQVEVSIQVDIQKRAAESQVGARRLADARGLRRILVSAIAARTIEAPSFRYRSW